MPVCRKCWPYSQDHSPKAAQAFGTFFFFLVGRRAGALGRGTDYDAGEQHSPASHPSLWEVPLDTALNLGHNQTGSVGLEVRRVLPCFVCVCEEGCGGVLAHPTFSAF